MSSTRADLPIMFFRNGNLIITRFVHGVRLGQWVIHPGLQSHAGGLTLSHRSSVAVLYGLSICEAAHALRQIQTMRPCPVTDEALVLYRAYLFETVESELIDWIDDCFVVVGQIKERIANDRYASFDWSI